MSRRILSISKVGRLHNLSKQPSPVEMRGWWEAFSCVWMEFPVLVCTHCPDPVTRHHWKVPGSTFFAPSLQVFIYIHEITLYQRRPRGNSPSYLSPSIILVTLHWTFCLSSFISTKKLSMQREDSGIRRNQNRIVTMWVNIYFDCNLRAVLSYPLQLAAAKSIT